MESVEVLVDNKVDADPIADQPMADRLAHPFGVEPEGNAWCCAGTSVAAARSPGLGRIALLDDALIVNELLAWVDGASLCGLCVASGALRCYASLEDLWKGIYLRRCGASGAPLRYAMGSWKCTTLGRARRAVSRRVFSDVLYHPHRLARGEPLGRTLDRDDVGACARERAASLTTERFVADYEAAGVPVVIEGGCAADAAKPLWDRGELVRRFGDRRFHVGGYAFALREFLSYAADNGDDQPLYLFDKRFGEAAPELLDAYAPAPYFDDDLFGLLDDEGDAKRPDWRWIIVGGERSGSAWHKDPNGTSAWNATLRGRKRWLFFPPKTTPPGVRPSADGLDLVAPLSLAEWAHAFYAEARAHPHFVEAHTGPGDVVFVPRGWWHSVVNLDDFNVALTHNFCSPRGLASTLRLLRDAPHLVSGIVRDERLDECDDLDENAKRAVVGAALHDRFAAALRRHRPAALDAAEAQLAAPTTLWAKLTAARDNADLVCAGTRPEPPPKKRAKATPGASGFSFNFGA